MKKLSMIFIILFVFSSVIAYAGNTAKDIKAIISRVKTQAHLKGVIYGVWQNGKPITIGAMGNSMTNVSVTTNMHFRIGGITETFLTTLLMQLVEQNKLSLDDTVSKWFPEFPDANKVTLKMLATTTSGYPDYVYNKEFIKDTDAHPFKAWTPQELLNYAFKTPMLFKPGSKWHYTHTDYVILGMIIQKATGETIEELLQKNILNKLHLNNTEFTRTAEMKCPVLHAFSKDRGIYEDSTFWSPSWTSYSGLIVSNIHDLGVWLNAFGHGKLLSKTAFKTQTTTVPTPKAEFAFAMGFAVMNHWYVQNPSFGGYYGVMGFSPKYNISIIIFSTKTSKSPNDKNFSVEMFTQLRKYFDEIKGR